MKPPLEFRPKRSSYLAEVSKCPPSAVSVATPAPASKGTKPSKAPKATVAALAMAKRIAAGSAKDGTSVAAKVASSTKPFAKSKRKSRAPKAFNRDEYQALYMRDRREADAAGFGPGPKHKTVKQYREWKSHQNDTT